MDISKFPVRFASEKRRNQHKIDLLNKLIEKCELLANNSQSGDDLISSIKEINLQEIIDSIPEFGKNQSKLIIDKTQLADEEGFHCD